MPKHFQDCRCKKPKVATEFAVNINYAEKHIEFL